METPPAWIAQVLGESVAGSETWLTSLMKLLVSQSMKKAQNTTATLLYACLVVTGLIALIGVSKIVIILLIVASFVIAFGYFVLFGAPSVIWAASTWESMKNPAFADVMLDLVVEQVRPPLLSMVRINNVVQWLMILTVIAGIPVFIYLFGWLVGVMANIALFIGSAILVVILNRVDFALCQTAMAKVAREQTEMRTRVDKYFRDKYGDE